MNDDRTTDERLAEAARESYNVPPATPRAEMWAGISARLEGERETETEVGRVIPFPSRAPTVPVRHRWWIGIAAALVIGLGIGRWTSGPGVDGGAPVAEGPRTDAVVDATPSGPVDSDPAAGLDTPPDARMDPAPAPEAGRGEQAGVDTPPSGAPRPTGLSYAVATRDHLARSEAFLAGVRTDLERGGAEPDFGPWARSLLGRTRLLLASPAGRDPATRRLLEDLELMLAQIAVTAATGDSAEARIVDEGLTDGDLMYRLRSATETRIGPGTTPGTRTSSL